MRSLAVAEVTGLAKRTVFFRDLLWMDVKDRDTGVASSFGFSTLSDNQNISVVDGRSNATVSRAFRGLRGALQIGPITLTADITVRTLDIRITAIDSIVVNLLRGYDPRNAPMQVYRVFFDPDNPNTALAAAKARFVGYLDTLSIPTPPPGEIGGAELRCVSTTRELTRTNSAVRSHENQLTRSATDNFFVDAGVVGKWQLFWGSASQGELVQRAGARRE